MSYGVSAALQAAIFQRLSGDAALSALVGGAIYDVVPAGPLPGTHVSLGPEEVRDRSDGSGSGAEHRLTVSVVSEAAGFQQAKTAAGIVADLLDGSAPSLVIGRVVSVRFLRARAYRVDAGKGRRIDLTFRARVEQD